MTSMLTEEQEKSIREQIENTYKEVWATLLHDKVKKNPPDFDWIVRLYKEIKYKLTYFLKQNSSECVIDRRIIRCRIIRTND